MILHMHMYVHGTHSGTPGNTSTLSYIIKYGSGRHSDIFWSILILMHQDASSVSKRVPKAENTYIFITYPFIYIGMVNLNN